MPIPIQNITEKVSIAGNGIVALMTAYFAFLRAKEEGGSIKISIRGKYPTQQTTSAFLVPSLSWSEILSVVPPGKKFIEALQILFTEFNGGILLEDGKRIIQQAEEFVNAAKSCRDEDITQRTKLLVEFSKLSLSLWDLLYETADEELRRIMIESNYLPCRERSTSELKLKDGYRLDVYYNAVNFEGKLETAIKENAEAGYQNTLLVNPDELLALDSSFKTFYEQYSTANESGVRFWKSGAGVIFRPGGCINTPIFLSKFADYLTKVMGTYVTENGKEKPCFIIKLGEVIGLDFVPKENRVTAFQVTNKPGKTIKRQYKQDDFVLCPGENVGTVRRLGLFEPPHSRYAGFSLKLNIPESLVYQAGFTMDYKCNISIRSRIANTAVIQVGQFGDSFSLGIGGLKAFLGLDEPNLNADYALKASIYQLNMLNQVYAPLISACLGRNTQGIELTQKDLEELIHNKFLTRWTGARACTHDGSPTIDYGHNENGQINNLIIATHLSSGGVTNSPGSAFLVDQLRKKQGITAKPDGFFSKIKELKNKEQILNMMRSTR